MISLISGESLSRRLNTIVPTFGLVMAAALSFGFTPAWALQNSSDKAGLKPEELRAAYGFEEIKPDSPEQQQIFTALNQWRQQTLVSYNYDLQKMQDPFMPIKETRSDPYPEIESQCSGVPLCSLTLTDLRLVAITVPADGSGALASFEDSTGASYILRTGDRVGRNQVRVLEITDSMVIIEEPNKALKGDRAHNLEFKLSVPGTPVGLSRSGEKARVL